MVFLDLSLVLLGLAWYEQFWVLGIGSSKLVFNGVFSGVGSVLWDLARYEQFRVLGTSSPKRVSNGQIMVFL